MDVDEIVTKAVSRVGAELARNNLPRFGGESKPKSVLSDKRLLGQWLKSVITPGAIASREIALERSKRFGGADLQKAVQEGVFTGGGAIVPIQTSDEVIAFLREEALLDKLGVVYTNFKAQLDIGKLNGGTTLQWVGEGATVPRTQPTYGKVILRAHKGMILTDISNDMLRNPEVGDAMVGEDMQAACVEGIDQAAITGTGTGGAPLGLLGAGFVNASNSFPKTGVTAPTYTADVDKAVRLVREGKVPFRNPAFLISPAREADLLGLNTSGMWTFRNEMLGNGTLRGFPYHVTTCVPDTTIVFGAWGHFIFGVDTEIEISYHDTRAEYDETVARAVLRVDFQRRYDKAFALITGY